MNDPKDNEIWAISPCISCPRCGEAGDIIDKERDENTGLADCNCWNCGEHWYEFYFDDEYEEDEQ